MPRSETMKLEEIANISQGIPLNRIRIKKGMKTRKEHVYSFEKESEMLIPLDIDETQQKIPLAKEDMIVLNLTSYNAKKIEKESIGKIIPSNYIIIEIKNKNIVDPDYLEWYIDKSQSFARELHKIKQGSIVLSIPINELRSIRLKLPSIDFQRKLGKVSKLNKKREELYRERKELIEKLLITVNEEEN